MILFCNFTFMGPTLVDFLFFCSFGWGPQIIFIIVFSFPFLLDVLNCAVLYQPTRLCNEAYIPSMAFYKKEELFQIIVEDSWIECISLFPAILINNLEENMESSGNGFFVYFVVFFFLFWRNHETWGCFPGGFSLALF